MFCLQGGGEVSRSITSPASVFESIDQDDAESNCCKGIGFCIVIVLCFTKTQSSAQSGPVQLKFLNQQTKKDENLIVMFPMMEVGLLSQKMSENIGQIPANSLIF